MTIIVTIHIYLHRCNVILKPLCADPFQNEYSYCCCCKKIFNVSYNSTDRDPECAATFVKEMKVTSREKRESRVARSVFDTCIFFIVSVVRFERAEAISVMRMWARDFYHNFESVVPRERTFNHSRNYNRNFNRFNITFVCALKKHTCHFNIFILRDQDANYVTGISST